jgi:hypothetical protein
MATGMNDITMDPDELFGDIIYSSITFLLIFGSLAVSLYLNVFTGTLLGSVVLIGWLYFINEDIFIRWVTIPGIISSLLFFAVFLGSVVQFVLQEILKMPMPVIPFIVTTIPASYALRSFISSDLTSVSGSDPKEALKLLPCACFGFLAIAILAASVKELQYGFATNALVGTLLGSAVGYITGLRNALKAKRRYLKHFGYLEAYKKKFKESVGKRITLYGDIISISDGVVAFETNDGKSKTQGAVTVQVRGCDCKEDTLCGAIVATGLLKLERDGYVLEDAKYELYNCPPLCIITKLKKGERETTVYYYFSTSNHIITSIIPNWDVKSIKLVRKSFDNKGLVSLPIRDGPSTFERAESGFVGSIDRTKLEVRFLRHKGAYNLSRGLDMLRVLTKAMESKTKVWFTATPLHRVLTNVSTYEEVKKSLEETLGSHKGNEFWADDADKIDKHGFEIV